MAGNDVVMKQTSFNICMPETKEVLQLLLDLLTTIPVLQKHSKFERMSGCNYCFIIEKG